MFITLHIILGILYNDLTSLLCSLVNVLFDTQIRIKWRASYQTIQYDEVQYRTLIIII